LTLFEVADPTGMAARPLTAPLVTTSRKPPVFVTDNPVNVATPALSVVATGSLAQTPPMH
jgi:hypothetical protein